jgi:prevent-host-death family protein
MWGRGQGGGGTRTSPSRCDKYPYNADKVDNADQELRVAKTTAVEFQRKLGEFQSRAQREPVEITRHGRRELVLMSADHYDWLTAAAKRTYRTSESPLVVIDAVEHAEMDSEHAHLDKLLK